jgi:hypothetical protein
MLTMGANTLRMEITGPGSLALHHGSLSPLSGWFSSAFEQRTATSTLQVTARGAAVQWTTIIREVQ